MSESVVCFLCGQSEHLQVIPAKKLDELYCKRCDVFTPITLAVKGKVNR